MKTISVPRKGKNNEANCGRVGLIRLCLRRARASDRQWGVYLQFGEFFFQSPPATGGGICAVFPPQARRLNLGVCVSSEWQCRAVSGARLNTVVSRDCQLEEVQQQLALDSRNPTACFHISPDRPCVYRTNIWLSCQLRLSYSSFILWTDSCGGRSALLSRALWVSNASSAGLVIVHEPNRNMPVRKKGKIFNSTKLVKKARRSPQNFYFNACNHVKCNCSLCSATLLLVRHFFQVFQNNNVMSEYVWTLTFLVIYGYWIYTK